MRGYSSRIHATAGDVSGEPLGPDGLNQLQPGLWDQLRSGRSAWIFMLDCRVSISPLICFLLVEKMFYIQVGWSNSNPLKNTWYNTRYIYFFSTCETTRGSSTFFKTSGSGTIAGALQDHSNSLVRGGFRIGAARLAGCWIRVIMGYSNYKFFRSVWKSALSFRAMSSSGKSFHFTEHPLSFWKISPDAGATGAMANNFFDDTVRKLDWVPAPSCSWT